MADETQTASPLPAEGVVELDPFDFFPTRRSALGGLGGSDDRTDPTYVMHTRYRELAPGRITYSVGLHDLAVTSGTLVLRVLAMPREGHGIDPDVAATAQIPLATIAERGGIVSIGINASSEATYALLGLVVDDTDATVSAITVTLDRLDHSETDAGGMAESSTTRFGTEASTSTALLLTSEPPTLARPVSQVRTEQQLDEPRYRRWCEALGARPGEDVWAKVYALRVFETYGVLQRGASGLLLGDADPATIDAIASRGIAISHFAPPFPDGLSGFDFLSSRTVCSALPTISDGLTFIENALSCLNVGGIAVHTFRFVADMLQDGEDVPGALVYTRAQIERLAFHLIVANHQIAQFSYALATGVKPRPTQFGLVIRKGSF